MEMGGIRRWSHDVADKEGYERGGTLDERVCCLSMARMAKNGVVSVHVSVLHFFSVSRSPTWHVFN